MSGQENDGSKVMLPAQERWRSMILTGFVIIILAQLLYHATPMYIYYPDVAYIKGKVLQVLRGNLFTDPVTGYVSMHPPWYHVFLAGFSAIGFNINNVLLVITITNVSLLFFFVFRIMAGLYNREVAFYTCLLLPFIADNMGCDGLLLSSSFMFSIPVYLAGLYFYLLSARSARTMIFAGVLWGMAFLISPVYFFLIGLTFVYELIFNKNRWLALLMIGVFLLTIIPFIYQFFLVFSRGMSDTETFVLWRGIPGIDWWLQFAKHFLRPHTYRYLYDLSIVHGVILLIAVAIIIKRRSLPRLIGISLAATFLTYYNFMPQYADRIQLFFSIFMVGMILQYLMEIRISRWLWLTPTLVFALFAIVSLQIDAASIYRTSFPVYNEIQKNGRGFKAFFRQHYIPDEYILCTKETYREYILPYFPVHALGAYKSMTYYQLPQDVADRMENDYIELMICGDSLTLDRLAAKYNIQTAVMYIFDNNNPVYWTLSDSWTPVYEDSYFVVFNKR